MSPELLAKLQKTYEAIHGNKERKVKESNQVKLDRQSKLYGTSNIRMFHGENGKLSVFVPEGMKSDKLIKTIESCSEKIQEFKENLNQNVLLL